MSKKTKTKTAIDVKTVKKALSKVAWRPVLQFARASKSALVRQQRQYAGCKRQQVPAFLLRLSKQS